MNRPPYPSTPKQARLWFKRHGVSISDWCRANKLAKHTVVDLLRGKLKGNYGDAHRAAVLLGLKEEPKTAREAA